MFDFEEYDSDNSDKSVIYISSSEDESSDWETDCSTDTEQLKRSNFQPDANRGQGNDHG